MASVNLSQGVAKATDCTAQWALSSAGRASALQAEGHRFEPYSAHFSVTASQLLSPIPARAGTGQMPQWRNWQTHRT